MYIPGDVVKLKSGGPSMTVYEGDKDGDDSLVGCCWFAKEGNYKFESKFNKYTLIKDTDETK